MKKQLPAFANETEEANWWYDNREEHAAEFVKAIDEGRVSRGGIVRRMAEAEAARNVLISLEDALKAARLAEAKGVEVQTYLADMLHNALQQQT